MITKILKFILYKNGYPFIFIFFSVIYFINFPLEFFVGGDALPVFLNPGYYDNTFFWTDSTLLGGVANRGVYMSMFIYTGLLKILINIFGLLMGQYIYNYILYILMSVSFYYGIEYLVKNKIQAIIITLFFILSSVGWWVVAQRGLLFISLYFFTVPLVGRIIIDNIDKKYNILLLIGIGILISPLAFNPGYFFPWIVSLLLYLLYIFLYIKQVSLKKVFLSFLILLISFIPIFTSYGIFFTQNTSLVNDSWNKKVLIKGSLKTEKKENILLNTLRGYKSFQNAGWGYDINDLDPKTNVFIKNKIDSKKGNYYYSFPGYKIYYTSIFSIVSWIPILILIFGFILIKNKKIKEQYIYWLTVLIITVFLMKSIAPPFGNIFKWMMDNIPLFGIFRGPQVKFSLIYLLSLLFVFIILFNYLNKKIKIKILSLLLLSYILIFGYYWFIGNAVPSIKLVKNIPNEYSKTSIFLKNNSKKALLLPFNLSTWTNTNFGYEGYSIFYTITPEIGIWNRNDGAFYKESDKILYGFLSVINKKTETFIKKLSKYNIDTIIYDGYTDRYPRFRKKEKHNENKLFLEQSGLNKVATFGKIEIWKVPKEYLKPNIYTLNNTNISIKKISPVRYDIKISNFTEDELYFLQSFHKEWKIYPKINNGNNFVKNLALKDIRYLFQPELFNENHSGNKPYGNKWYISKEMISPKYYKKNNDGSIDINLTLYFKPQLYFYISIIITILIYLILFIFILYKKHKLGKK